ncbi:MAG: flagellar basal-body rod protein FlgF [Zhaonellaceae bacterium]|jgi:flagellar basal-body rod protein FlgG|nr:flagellar basal-body rod protein FlgF [Clostridia bacterium]
MIRGLYTAATGMLVQELRQENISNNLVNANTAGYKSSKLAVSSFPEVLLSRIDAINGSQKGFKPIGTINNGAMLSEKVLDLTTGSLEETNNPLDLALAGEGFFTLATPQGIRYSRNGSFRLDGDGYLIDNHGNYVLGMGGPVFLDRTDFSLSQDGTLTIDGQYVDTILITTFNDETQLQKQGNDLFASLDGAGPRQLDPASVNLKQGFIEKPNINLVDEMVNMLTVIRTYEANQKVIQAHDEVLGKSVNEIGSLR